MEVLNLAPGARERDPARMPVLDLADVGERAVCFARTGHFAAGERVVDRKRQVGRLEDAKRYQDRVEEIDARLKKMLDEMERKAKTAGGPAP